MARVVRHLLAIALLSGLAQPAVAQLEELKVTYSASGVSPEEAIKTLSDKYGFTYSFNPDIFENYGPLSFSVKRKPLDQALGGMFNDPSIGWRLTGNSVILFKRPIKVVAVNGKFTDYRSGEGIGDVRVSIPGYNTSTLTDSSGGFSIQLQTYADSVKVYAIHRDYEEITFWTPARSKPFEQDLVPLPDYLPKMPFLSDPPTAEQQLTASIEENFIVQTVTPDQVMQEAQTDSARPFYSRFHVSFIPPISNHGLKSGLAINNASLNMISGYSWGLEGVEAGGIANVIRNDMKGVQVAGFGNFVGGHSMGVQAAGFFNLTLKSFYGVQAAGFVNVSTKQFNGVQAAGFNNVSWGKTRGVQASGFSNISAGEFNGVQASGFHNTTAGKFNGVQAAGFINTAHRQFNGIQASGFLNVHTGRLRGLQGAGFLNVAGDVSGVQASGFLNVAQDVNGMQAAGFINVGKNVKGVQLGFLNVADSMVGVPIGFLNIVVHGLHNFELTYNELGMLSLAFKTGTHGLHNIFYGMMEPVDGRKEWGVGYGIGSMTSIERRFQVGGAVTSVQLSENGALNGLNVLNRAQLQFGIKIVDGLSLVAGPSYNLLVKEPQTASASDVGYRFTPFQWEHTPDPGQKIQSWIGFDAGLRF